ncbi:hypothetical protein HTZ97_04595 [Desulfuromonas acetoxidans]|nr:hypothetical protein [Desulfuromonas acetoxidans]MBF0645236.1 hypothetical protein [Desulfuromonas acetoxidans]NVD23020.1 hypothetical protein [Desulfuromonas acetoxidans]NVE15739.1 hypothetical protein [Desulfuromonas acetoxidans]
MNWRLANYGAVLIVLEWGDFMLILRSTLIWLLFVVVAFGNGLLRQQWLEIWLPVSVVLPVSGLLLCCWIALLCFILFPWVSQRQPGRYWAVGWGWMLLTFAFEVGFGHWGLGRSWDDLIQVLAFWKGDFFFVVLLVSLVLPRLCAYFYRLD